MMLIGRMNADKKKTNRLAITIDELAKVLYESDFSFKLDRENGVVFVLPSPNCKGDKHRIPKVIVRYIEVHNLIRVRTTNDFRIGDEGEINYLRFYGKTLKCAFVTVKYKDDETEIIQVLQDVSLKNGQIDTEKLERVVRGLVKTSNNQ